MYNKKGYFDILALISILFVQILVRIRESYCSAQVGVEPVNYHVRNSVYILKTPKSMYKQ